MIPEFDLPFHRGLIRGKSYGRKQFVSILGCVFCPSTTGTFWFVQG
jgi:hypothetical protein